MLSIDNDELMDFNKLKKQADPISNDTRQPRVGDKIYVLGSNESIQVGKNLRHCLSLDALVFGL